MEYQIVTLSIIAILNAVFSYFVVKGGNKITNTIFSLVTISVSLWALNLTFFIESSDINNVFIFANLYYIFAAAIPVLFFCFSLVFPIRDVGFKNKYYLSFIPFILLILAIISDKNTILKEISIHNSIKDVVLNTTNYLFYGAYFIFFVLASYFVLIKKYKKVSNNTEKAQLILVIYGTAISYLLGMVFNLFLPWFGNYNLIWLGPLFSLIMVASIGYAIIKHHLFNVKVIATEILTFLLVFFILVRTIISDTLQEQIINSVLLFVVSVFGTLLIHSVLKEVETREKIEKLAEDLKTANARLKKMDKQKSEFISIASHQLRGPVTSLKGYSSMILDGSYGPTSEKINNAIKRLFQSSQNLALIIDDFLNLSRIERGKIEYCFAPTDLKTIIESATEEIANTAQTKGLKLNLKINKGTYEANLDGEKIKQIISNLIDNAIKYTIKGSVNIELSRDNKKFLLKVSDTGIGFPKDSLSKLFKKFGRLDNANDANIKGTGLGLYLAKEIIKAHKGKIWAESKGENKGSTFFVELKAIS